MTNSYDSPGRTARKLECGPSKLSNAMPGILIPLILNWKAGELTFPKRVKDVMGAKVLQVKFVNKICHPPTPVVLLIVARLLRSTKGGRIIQLTLSNPNSVSSNSDQPDSPSGL